MANFIFNLASIPSHPHRVVCRTFPPKLPHAKHMNNTYMMNGPGAAQPPSWQDNHRPPPERRALSIPGGLPPTITPPPLVAQFGASAPTPAKSDTKRPENAKNEEGATFPELGRAGSVFGWFVNWVSPRTETGPSADAATTSGNLILSAAEANG